MGEQYKMKSSECLLQTHQGTFELHKDEDKYLDQMSYYQYIKDSSASTG